jgi:DedD protein
MMERRVKERLIGATLLVVLIVLIVPEMLSGPKPPSAKPLTVGLPTSIATPTRSVSVDLATSKATAESAPPPPAGAASQGAVSDEPSSTASGSAAGNDSNSESVPPDQDAPASAPTVTTLKAQEPSGSALETPPSAPRSASSGSRPDSPSDSPARQQGHRGWAVQLGSFASRANAEKLVHQLQARGGSSLYVSASGSGSSLRYRVRVGPLADRGAAERAAGKLRAAGHPATLVAPAS